MKEFEQLRAHDQILLLLTATGMLVESAGGFEELARLKECSLQDVWRSICREAGLDQCIPWQGFPAVPADLPDAPGGFPDIDWDDPLLAEVWNDPRLAKVRDDWLQRLRKQEN